MQFQILIWIVYNFLKFKRNLASCLSPPNTNLTINLAVYSD